MLAQSFTDFIHQLNIDALLARASGKHRRSNQRLRCPRGYEKNYLGTRLQNGNIS